jgi:hypothetical protein
MAIPKDHPELNTPQKYAPSGISFSLEESLMTDALWRDGSDPTSA